jgi:hypothetical protein
VVSRRMTEGVNLTMNIVRTFVNVTMYPQYNNNMIIKKLRNIKINKLASKCERQGKGQYLLFV